MPFVGIDPDRATALAGRLDRSSDELTAAARKVRAALASVGEGDGPARGMETIARWCDDSAADLRRRIAAATEEADSFLYLIGAFGNDICPNASWERWLAEWFPELSGRATVADVRRFLAHLDSDERLRFAKEVAHRFEAVKVTDLGADAAYLRTVLAPLREVLVAHVRRPAVDAYVGEVDVLDDDVRELAHLARVLRLEPPRRTADPITGFLNGLFLSDLDRDGYDTAGGQRGRLLGQLLSGFGVVGNIRDALADAHHGDVTGFALNTVGIIPGFGDAADGMRAVDRAGRAASIVEEGGDLARAARAIPLGFRSADEFAEFARRFRSGLAAAGFEDAEVLIRGSAVTGQSYKTGRAFDLGRVSDFDLALASDKMLEAARQAGIALRSGQTRTGPLSKEQLELLGLNRLIDDMSKLARRPVSLMIYRSVDDVTRRGPSAIVQ